MVRDELAAILISSVPVTKSLDFFIIQKLVTYPTVLSGLLSVGPKGAFRRRNAGFWRIQAPETSILKYNGLKARENCQKSSEIA